MTGGDDLLECHARLDAETFLRDDRPLVEVHAHEVRRHAGNFHAMLVRLPVRLRAGETRQQRGVNVDDLVLESPDEVRRQNFHEPRQHDEIRLRLF